MSNQNPKWEDGIDIIEPVKSVMPTNDIPKWDDGVDLPQAEVSPVMQVPDTSNLPLEEDGVGTKAWKAATGTLAGIAGQGIMKLPKFAEDWNNELFKQAFTKVAGVFGVDKENADHAWKSYDEWSGKLIDRVEKGTGNLLNLRPASTLANSPEAKWLTDKANQLEGESQISNKTIFDLAKEGSIGKATAKIGVEIARSLPYTLTALGGGTPGLVAMGLTTASKEYDDIKDSDVDTAAKLTEATINGTAEALGEYIGTAQIGKFLAGSFKTLGAKAAGTNIKNGLEAYMSGIFKKYGLLAEATAEGVSEFATTIAQNADAIYTGIDPSRGIMDGAVDSFIVGVAQGGIMGGGGKVAGKVYNKLSGSQAPGATIPGQSGPVSPDSTPIPVLDPRQQAEQNLRDFHASHADKDSGMLRVIGQTTPDGEDTKNWFITKEVDGGEGNQFYIVEDGEGGHESLTKAQVTGDIQEINADDYVIKGMEGFDQQQSGKIERDQNQMTIDGNVLTRQKLQLEDGSVVDEWIDKDGNSVDVPKETTAIWDKQKAKDHNANPDIVNRTYGKTNVIGTKDQSGNIVVDKPMTLDQVDALKAEVERTTGGKATVQMAQITAGNDATLQDTYEATITPVAASPVIDPAIQAQVEAETAQSYNFNGKPMPKGQAEARVRNAIFTKNQAKLNGLEINNDPELTAAIDKAFPKPKAKFTIGKVKATPQDAIDHIQSSDDLAELQQLNAENIEAEPEVKAAYDAKMLEFVPNTPIQNEVQADTNTTAGETNVVNSTGTNGITENINEAGDVSRDVPELKVNPQVDLSPVEEPVIKESLSTEPVVKDLLTTEPSESDKAILAELHNTGQYAAADYKDSKGASKVKIVDQSRENSILAIGNTLQEAFDKAKKIKPELFKTIDQQIEDQEVNENPTEAQKEVGNYKKAHIDVQGMAISIENPVGSVRRGKDEDGKAWEHVMKSHYGYFKQTEGHDGDHIDCFIGSNPGNKQIFVIDQVNPSTGLFDESKVMIGYSSVEEARQAYSENYDKDWKGLSAITEVDVAPFKEWLHDGYKQRKPFAEYKDTPNPISNGQQGNSAEIGPDNSKAGEKGAVSGDSGVKERVKKEKGNSEAVVPELTPEQRISSHNTLVGAIENYNSISAFHVNKRRPVFQEIQSRSQKLGLQILTLPKGKIEVQKDGIKIRRIAIKQSKEDIEDHKSLSEYDEATRGFINSIIDTPSHLNGLEIVADIQQGARNIKEGKKTVAANAVLDALEAMYNDGVIRLRRTMNTPRAEVPISEYFAIFNEPLDKIDLAKEDEIFKNSEDNLRDIAEYYDLTPTELEEVDNLFIEYGYESQIDKGTATPSDAESKEPGSSKDIAGEIQQAGREEVSSVYQKQIEALAAERTKLSSERKRKESELNNRNGLFGDVKAPVNDIFSGEGFDASQIPQVLKSIDDQIKAIDTQVDKLKQLEKTGKKEASGQVKNVIPEEKPLLDVLADGKKANQDNRIGTNEDGNEVEVEGGEDGPMFSTSSNVTGEVTEKPSREQMQTKIDELQSIAPNAAPVILVESPDQLPDELKGKEFFAAYLNGKVYVMADKVQSIEQIIGAWVHENGVHNGVNNLIPEEVKTELFTDIHNSFIELAKTDGEIKRIVDHVNKNYSNLSEAKKGEEMLAVFAESTVKEADLTTESKTLWNKITSLLNSVLAKIFNVSPVAFSKQDLKDIIKATVQSNFQSKREALRNNPAGLLDYINNAHNRVQFNKKPIKSDKQAMLSLQPVGELIEYGAKKYKEVQEIKRTWKEKIQGWREAMQDADLPVRRLEELIKKMGGIINDTTKPYRQLNLSFGRFETICKEFADTKMKPIIQTIHKIGKVVNSDYVLPYVIAKQALVRNAKMRTEELDKFIAEHPEASQKSLDDKWNELKDRDFSGITPFDKRQQAIKDELTAWTELNPDATQPEYNTKRNELISIHQPLTPDELANGMIGEFEAAVPQDLIDELWNNIGAATSETVNTWYKSKTITKETRDQLLSEKFFVPLRGWREGDAKLLAYSGSKGGFGSSFQHAKGRTSLAENPLAYIQKVGFDAISEQIDTESKRQFWNLVVNNYGPKFQKLYKIQKAYYIKTTMDDGSEGWTLSIDPSTGDMIKPTAEQFKNGEAKYTLNTQHEQYRPYNQAKQHEVIIKTTSGDMVVIMLGDNLVVGQAMNKRNTMVMGLLGGESFDSKDFGGKLLGAASRGTHFMTAAMTQWNVTFPFRNFARDAVESAVTQGIKGENGLGVMANYKHSFPAIFRALSGKTGANNKYDDYNKEFYEAGGSTGYSHLKTPEQVEKDINDELDRMMREDNTAGWMRNLPRKALHGIATWNMIFEDATRLSVFITAREGGKTIKEAASEAKEASVNFNRSGKISKAANSLFGFFNATVQAGQKNMSLFKHYPKRACMAAASFAVLGFMEAMMNASLPGDDDDDYWNISEFMRENYLILPNFPKLIKQKLTGEKLDKGDQYMSFPLPQFWRAFKSLGTLVYNVNEGKTTWDKAGLSFTSNLLASLTPFDLGGIYQGGEFSPLRPFIPTILKPIAEVNANMNYMGFTIMNEPFTKVQKDALADSGLGKSNVNPAIKFFTDALFRKVGGGDNETKYYTDKDGNVHKVNSALDWNPSMIQHLVEGYTAGTGKFVMDVAKTAYSAVSPDEPIDFKDIPFVNAFIRKTPEAKWTTIREYYELKKEIEGVDVLSKAYYKTAEYDKYAKVTSNAYYNEYAGAVEGLDEAVQGLMDTMDYKTASGSEDVLNLMKTTIDKVKEIKLKYNR